MCMRITVVHNTAKTVMIIPPNLQTNITAQMLSSGGEWATLIAARVKSVDMIISLLMRIFKHFII